MSFIMKISTTLIGILVTCGASAKEGEWHRFIAKDSKELATKLDNLDFTPNLKGRLFDIFIERECAYDKKHRKRIFHVWVKHKTKREREEEEREECPTEEECPLLTANDSKKKFHVLLMKMDGVAYASMPGWIETGHLKIIGSFVKCRRKEPPKQHMAYVVMSNWLYEQFPNKEKRKAESAFPSISVSESEKDFE